MILHPKGYFWGLHMNFTDYWLERSIGRGVYDEASPEQLWLAFVMKEKYNKVWNGEDWVKV
jgi:hypothetical protein